MKKPRHATASEGCNGKAAPAAGKAGAAKRKGESYAGRHALVVEADKGTRELCRKLLENHGFIVVSVETGVAAITATRKQVPDVIFLDQQLRDVPGAEILSWLRSNPALRTTPVIAISAFAEDAFEGDLKGVSAVLKKPLSPARFEHVIREMLK